MADVYERIGIRKEEAVQKLGEFAKELISNLTKWTAFDLVEWIADEENSANRKLKLLTFITLIVAGNERIKIRR